MTTRWMGPGLAAAGLCLALLLGGCQQRQERMVTGTVDTTIILRYDDAYQKMAQDYVKERAALTRQLAEALRQVQGGAISGATYKELSQKEADLAKRWLDKTREFVRARKDQIGTAAQTVALEKGLDLVILDSSDMPTVEFGGLDITEDVLGEMPGIAGGVGDQKAPAKPQEAK